MSVSIVLPPHPVPTMDAYLDAEDRPGGTGIETAMQMAPDEIITEVTDARLRGRGGAGFPTGRKWESVRSLATEDEDVYLVCNAAEGEPGTYKDRAILSQDPYQVVEGICIALRATGARHAYIGIKELFVAQRERLDDAVGAARAAGWEGADRITVVAGPDEYLFGEEKGMLEVIEGKLPFPRILPPYMQGLHATMQSANPTAVNNVETLAHVAHILAHGASEWGEVGTEETPGTMVFTVTGDCASPGVYELPLGTSLRSLVCDIAGADDPKAIVPGVSNAIISPSLLDLPMDFESFAEAGTGLGSGGFIVYGQHRDIAQVARTLARFLSIESCGQCNACSLGTSDMASRFDAIVEGRGSPGDLEAIRLRTLDVTDQNRCYLPVGAAQVVSSILAEFGDELAERVAHGSAPDSTVPTPKIKALTDDGVEWDPEYHRKLEDWSFQPRSGPASDT